jgi:hypothetical protein
VTKGTNVKNMDNMARPYEKQEIEFIFIGDVV